ncbi:MmcQ/YjbR family DNA-binding protein [Dietzia sp. PP-33]|jgi:hypothetical protein|uniref:MmcQ/YjbR family DNA-binding protein n=1 Tax=Dietzia sp. PP-33 TaxID=2957500 RepID=UPI0029B8B76B|nr:MmcQ/YjbR family DNA-binding protein [Dietzia sp. PP-33]MDX2356616.1 MmcQ/YjbR family DNA-binding protein [Dietzia sp. PP-33]
MTSPHTARRLALELPGATEQDHHGFPSFRVRGRIFATLPATDRLRAMLDAPGIRTAAAEHPDVCAEFYWGKRLACVEIDLPRADTELIRELLADAWEHRSGQPRPMPPAQ